MYKIKYKYHEGGWFNGWSIYSESKAREEFRDACMTTVPLDRVELYKFRWLKWEWELISAVDRNNTTTM